MRKYALAGLAFLASIYAAMAATTPNSIITPQTPSRGLQTWVQGTDAPGAVKTIYTGGSNGSKCVGLSITNGDTVTAHTFSVYVTAFGGSPSVPVGNISLPAGAGTGGTTTASGFPQLGLPLDSDGNSFLYLKSGDTLAAFYGGSLASNAVIGAMATCADF